MNKYTNSDLSVVRITQFLFVFVIAILVSSCASDGGHKSVKANGTRTCLSIDLPLGKDFLFDNKCYKQSGLYRLNSGADKNGIGGELWERKEKERPAIGLA